MDEFGDDPVTSALRTCEAALRRFAADAASAGDYDRLTRLVATGRAVSELIRQWSFRSTAIEPGGSSFKTKESRPLDDSEPSSRSGRAPAARTYPRFIRRGDDLVKVGWSKRERREYQHRASYQVLADLKRALLDAAKRRRLFTMDVLSRLNDGSIAGYQGYVWLAWLRSASLIKQHGRQGYSVVNPDMFETDVERSFALVPSQ